MPGISISVTRTSGFRRCTSRHAISPSAAVPTTSRSLSSAEQRRQRTAHQRLILGQQDADHAGSPTRTRTFVPPPLRRFDARACRPSRARDRACRPGRCRRSATPPRPLSSTHMLHAARVGVERDARASRPGRGARCWSPLRAGPAPGRVRCPAAGPRAARRIPGAPARIRAAGARTRVPRRDRPSGCPSPRCALRPARGARRVRLLPVRASTPADRDR